ncbi:hypothetical protein D3C76_334260 [compost metagenome]
MGFNDYVTLSCYVLSLLCALYILIAHVPYYIGRFKAGVVNLFMLAMGVFLIAYILKMGTAVWTRLSKIFSAGDALTQAMQTNVWTVAMLGTTFAFVSVALLTYKNRFDIWVYLRKPKKNKDEVPGGDGSDV